MRVLMFGLVGLLAACGSVAEKDTGDATAATANGSEPVTTAAMATPIATPVAMASSGAAPEGAPAGGGNSAGAVDDAAAAPGGDRSCRAEIGAAAAAKLVAKCRDASPATHPPCNAANSCAMIQDEIDRSCKLFADSDPLPAYLCPPRGPTSVQAHATPVALVRDYYGAIAGRDYGRAYRLWSRDGQASGKTLDAFARGFADTATTSVSPGTPSAPEGAAGSTYVTVPVTVRATTRGGAVQRFTGQYVVRRVNDVPGATTAQLDWRIDSASLQPVR